MTDVTKPAIIERERMTARMRVYWEKKAESLTGKVDVVDPWRYRVETLKRMFPRGTRVYRASTGGRWGKSAEIYTL